MTPIKLKIANTVVNLIILLLILILPITSNAQNFDKQNSEIKTDNGL